MYGRLKGKKLKKRASFWENVIAVSFGVLTFVLAGEFHKNGIQAKWTTAVLVTIAPFGMVMYGYRALLGRWAFWDALSICLALYTIGIWLLFGYVLVGFTRIGILLWTPLMIAERLSWCLRWGAYTKC